MLWALEVIAGRRQRSRGDARRNINVQLEVVSPPTVLVVGRSDQDTNNNMDGTGPGEAGVLQWANSIRFSMANDPAREVLAIQIQKGFDFLDSYLESVLSGPKEEYWIFMKHMSTIV